HSDRPGGVIAPVDRKQLREHLVQRADSEGANDGDLVRFELHKSGRSQVSRARIIETLGNPDDQRQISLIAIHAHGLNDTFPQRVVDELADLPKLTPDHRADLRDLPLITIDPPDARDHDDAVHAKRDADPKNRGGFIVTVAIADVAHYVQPGTELDREALRRGNSVYFPDRVVPMLPEEISNGLCSLVEGEDRPCLAVTMVFGADGTKQSHKFVRGLMRSAKKLAYAQAQAAFDGRDPPDPYERSTPVLRDLFDAYTLLRKAREARSPLDLDLPERRLVLNTDGQVSDVVVPERHDAHKLIEEFMIQANVAAAEELEQRKSAVVYRCHDKPSKEKLTSLREFLETLDLALPPHGQLKPAAFNRILSQAKDMPVRDLVNEVVLRSQAQAEYTVENLGHFGLNLRRYAHFTSPIRRYADLLVHRALIASAGLGDDGSKTQRETKNQGDEPAKDSASYGEVKESLGRICEQISQAERKAMAAERETIDRLIASHLADRVGAKFKGRVTGVTRSGLFVRLNETGADGLVPISSLGDEYFHHVEEAHALIGEDSGRGFTLGDEVDVRLIEAVPTAGALRFEMLSEARRQNHSRTPRGMRKPGRFARGRSYKATGVSPKNRSFKKSSKGRR
ncbi:MAG: ribonuclease R, partial [Pseudomonadota bacterium]